MCLIPMNAISIPYVRIHLTTGKSGTKHGQGIRIHRMDLFNECGFLNEIRADCLTVFCPNFPCGQRDSN